MNAVHVVEEAFEIWKNKSVKAKGGYLRHRTVVGGWASNCSCGKQIVTEVNSYARHEKAVANHIAKVGA